MVQDEPQTRVSSYCHTGVNPRNDNECEITRPIKTLERVKEAYWSMKNQWMYSYITLFGGISLVLFQPGDCFSD